MYGLSSGHFSEGQYGRVVKKHRDDKYDVTLANGQGPFKVSFRWRGREGEKE